MTTLLNKPDARLRRFVGGGPDLDAPVDALGRMRHRAVLDSRQITRAVGDEPTVAFHGHAAVFNKRTLIGSKRWGFWEQIANGSFAKTIQEADVRFLVNHDPSMLLARNKAGTMSLSEDDTGLVTDAPSLDLRQSYTNDFAIALERGDISQMSFAFEPIEWRLEELDDGKMLVTLTEVRLWDVSIVTYPAYEDTDAGLRSLGFDALTRSLGLDPVAVLERLESDDLAAYVSEQIDRGATSGDTNEPGPAETTRDSDGRPAETTAPTSATALRHLAMRTARKGT